ncbi:MAG: polysaccharide biosynthesis tyrosine autokinase, partial [Ignavibacteriaceae bacterium]|nr:polysaccharide biosynthesis tyrosine autokinase [Ignavibacteriaceae bacterium]
VYESTVILKKESASKNAQTGDFLDMVQMQTEDEVETEIELVKTVDILSYVAKKLNLNVKYEKIVTSSGNTIVLDKPALEISDPEFNTEVIPFRLPQIVSIDLKNYDESAKFLIVKDNKDNFSIYSEPDEKLIQTIKSQIIYAQVQDTVGGSITLDSTFSQSPVKMNILKFDTPLAIISLNWTDVPIGSKIYFNIYSLNNVLDWFNKSISVEKTGKTSLFSVSVFSNSPYMAKELANAIVDRFRESRMEQKKQIIRYSYNFVDEQLQDMQSKLRESEDNLSRFKSSNQITTIDASSEEIVNFLSSLEAEKMNTELKLNEYKNKMEDLKKQMQTSGYFDQNLLSSEGSGKSGDPFASLLSQISNLELQKLELLQKRTENHPDVISLQKQINLAKEKLSSYNQNTLTAYQILINSLNKKLIDISNIISKYEVKLGRLPSQENTFARLLREKSVYEKMFTLLLDKREEMRVAELSKLQDIIIVDPAVKPIKPIGPRKLFTFLIAIVLGSFVGILSIFIVELKNSKLVNLDEIDMNFRIPVLSIIPKYTRAIKSKIAETTDVKDKFVFLLDEDNGFKETYNLLRTKLELQLLDKKKIFMITSCEENSGKSTIVGNLAISFAMNSKRILIIDCDLRKAGLSRLFEVGNEKEGLIDYLTKGTPPVLHTSVSKMIDILPTGGLTSNSSNLLNSERMENLFSLFDTSVYDYVIIDTPPVTKVVDSLILGKYVKDAMMVVRPDLSLKENVKGGLMDLTQARIKVRGIIVNAAEIAKSYYYKNRYGYGYGYSYGDNGKESNRVKKIINSKIRRNKSTTLNQF